MFKYLNQRIKNLDVLDISLTKMAVLFFTIAIVKIWPALLQISFSVLITLVILLAIRPMYSIWFKKNKKAKK